jgi:hypothetical protein
MRVERTETKFMLTVDEYAYLIKVIPEILEADENNGPFGYRITSLYFDSAFNTDYYAKIDGLEDRKKIRLRFYGSNKDKIKLEMKIKQNTFQAKESRWINREDAMALQECDFEVLKKYNDPVLEKLRKIMTFNGYRPSVKVVYNRLAFVGAVNGTRITFDTDVRSSELCLDLFSDQVLFPLPDSYFAILEVKSTGELPSYIKGVISMLDQSSRAVSKYREGRWMYEEIGLI